MLCAAVRICCRPTASGSLPGFSDKEFTSVFLFSRVANWFRRCVQLTFDRPMARVAGQTAFFPLYQHKDLFRLYTCATSPTSIQGRSSFHQHLSYRFVLANLLHSSNAFVKYAVASLVYDILIALAVPAVVLAVISLATTFKSDLHVFFA